MQPLKRRSFRANAGAAADYVIAKLGWLRGFPAAGPGGIGLEWVRLPPLGARDGVARFEIDAERIRRTEFGRNRAQAKFPAALPRVVGDVAVWSAAVDAQLSLVKAALYEGAPWPDLEALFALQGRRRAVRDRARSFVAAQPALRDLVVALAWMHWLDERAFIRALDAAKRHAETFERISGVAGGSGQAMVVRSAQLAVEGVDMKTIALFAHPYRAETEAGAAALLKPINAYLERAGGVWDGRIDDSGMGPWPSGHDVEPDLFLPDVIAAFEGLKGPVLRRAAALFDCVAPIDQAAAWGAWRQELRRLRRDASDVFAAWRASCAQRDTTPSEENAGSYAYAVDELNARFNDLEAKRPPPMPGRAQLRDMLAAARDLARDEPPEVGDAILRALRALAAAPDQAARPRPPLLEFRPAVQGLLSWRRRSRTSATGRKALAELARVQAELAALDPTGAARNALRDLIEDVADIISFDKPQKRLIAPLMETVRRLAEAVIALRRAGPPERVSTRTRRLDICLARPLLLGGASPAAATSIVLEIAGWEWRDGVNEDELARLFDLCGRDADTLARLLPLWRGRPHGERIDRALKALCAAPGAAPIALDSALDGEIKRVLRLARHLALCDALRAPTPPPEALAATVDWSRYPKPLHAALQALETVDPDAETAAAAILKADFPAISDLETERAAITARLSAGASGDAKDGLARRRAALDARIATARAGRKELSTARLGKYEQKIRRRARLLRLAAYEEATARALRSALGARLSSEGFSEGSSDASSDASADASAPWIDRLEALNALAAIEELPKAFRSLGWRVVRVRQGPKPWDLRDAPKNRAYLRRLERAGVKTTPWVEGLAPRPVPGAEPPSTLSFEEDPVEILQMGAPFDTCLAPGAFNFFSAVSNAIDINKRVLYARDAEGRVRARCLLALTAEGAITPFRVYAHSFAEAEAVTAAVAEAVRELAQSMGVAIVQSNAIPTLEAPRWYDDGPVDITGASSLFRDDAALEAWFDERPLSAAPTALRERIGAPVSPAHLVALAESKAVQERPERFEPFARLIGDGAALDPETRIRLAEALAAAGVRDKALELLSGFLRAPPPRDEYDGAAWRGGRAAEVFMSLNAPSRALRALIVSRSKGVRDWSSEGDARALVAARALAALYRRHQAASLLQKVIGSHDHHHRERARTYLKELRAER